MLHGKTKITLVIAVIVATAVSVLGGAVIYLKITYDHLTEKGKELLWLLNENEVERAHDLFDHEAGKVFTVADMSMVNRQMDGIIGVSGNLTWTGTFQLTWLAPLTVVIRWKADYSLAKEPVLVTMSFIKRGGRWRIGGLWYDSKEVRGRPLLTSIRFTDSLDDKLKPERIRKAFNQEDEYAYLWTMWQGLNGRHVVTMKWIDPSGSVHYTFDYDVSTKPERKSRIVWSRIRTSKPGSAALPGMWKVEIMLDGKTVEVMSIGMKKTQNE
jgi:hypothetical protein